MNILNAEQAAKMLDTSIDVVRRACKSRKLKARKVGREWRIKESAIEQYLEGEQDTGFVPVQLEGKKWPSINVAKRGILTSKATDKEYAEALTQR